MLAAAMGAGVAAVDTPVQVAVAARAVQPGELAVFTVTTSEKVDVVRVHAFQREIPAFKEDESTWRALVGIDLGVQAQTYVVSIDVRAGGRTYHQTYPLDVRPKHFPTRTLHVDEAFVNPPVAMAARIAAEAATLNELWKRPAGHRLWHGPFSRPVLDPATSTFGTRSIFNGAPRSPHAGADFLSPIGTPVRAPNAGRVVLARDFYFSGNTVVIDHGLGLFSLLAHLSAFEVREGDEVEGGTIVGRVGSTGRVTGPHLHWAVRAANARVDPLSLLAVLGPER